MPWVKDTERLTFGEIAPRFWRAAARYGFMERPDIPVLLQQAHERGCAIDLSDITYYVGHETVVPGEDEKRPSLERRRVTARHLKSSNSIRRYSPLTRMS